MTDDKKIKAIIVGASGYTGAELIGILHVHPNVEFAALVADSNAGKKVGEVHPQFADLDLPALIKLNEVNWNGVDVAFCCLPHATSQEVIGAIPKNVKVIDLSADFRLRDPKVYEEWYKHKHSQLELQKEAVYGLTEIYREQIKKARLIANPGCYPTSILLPLIPLLKDKVISTEDIIVNSKSGYSGAGAKAEALKAEVQDSVKAYGLDGHRHVAEIEQELKVAFGKDIIISFTPHALPIFKGMTSNINVKLAQGKTADDVKKSLQKAYGNDKFIKLLNDGSAPAPKNVNNTNLIEIGVFPDRIPGRCRVISAIDNLFKGASGQAVHNMNLMFGFAEDAGLAKT